MSAGDVYLIAPLGLSPGVLTETLWWLAVQEGRRIVGVELWVTEARDGGEAALQRLWQAIAGQDLWGRLRAAAGDRSSLLPELPARVASRRPRPDQGLAPGLTVFAFEHEDGPLADVRATEEANGVSRQLHARVGYLCRTLGDTTLVGSIAGGRKNFGAALQGAFEFEARPKDRLVHVLLHPEIERDRVLMEQFVVPDPGLAGIPVGQQISLFDIPFPPLRSLLPDWAPALDAADPVGLWSEFRRNMADSDQLTARLVVRPRDGDLEISGPDGVRFTLPLRGALLDLYVAVVTHPREHSDPKAQLSRWHSHIIEQGQFRDRSSKKTDVHAVEERLSQLARLTAALTPRGLGAFAVVADGGKSHVPAASRVERPPPRPPLGSVIAEVQRRGDGPV